MSIHFPDIPFDASPDMILALEEMARSGVGWPCFHSNVRGELQDLADLLLRLSRYRARSPVTVITDEIYRQSTASLEAIHFLMEQGSSWDCFDQAIRYGFQDVADSVALLLKRRRQRFIRSVTHPSRAWRAA